MRGLNTNFYLVQGLHFFWKAAFHWNVPSYECIFSSSIIWFSQPWLISCVYKVLCWVLWKLQKWTRFFSSPLRALGGFLTVLRINEKADLSVIGGTSKWLLLNSLFSFVISFSESHKKGLTPWGHWPQKGYLWMKRLMVYGKDTQNYPGVEVEARLIPASVITFLVLGIGHRP